MLPGVQCGRFAVRLSAESIASSGTWRWNQHLLMTTPIPSRPEDEEAEAVAAGAVEAGVAARAAIVDR
jgi:hypothetical protein